MRRILAILVVAVLLGSCSGASDSAAPPPATTQAAAAGQIDGSFDVGGYSLHLRCQGTGSQGHRPRCTCMAWAATGRTSRRSTPRSPARSGSAPTTA